VSKALDAVVVWVAVVLAITALNGFAGVAVTASLTAAKEAMAKLLFRDGTEDVVSRYS